MVGMTKMIEQLKQKAKSIKRDTLALYLAFRHPGVPWYARLLAIVVAGYAFSPIDLIPDFIPVIGYLDDLILVPLGIYLVIKLIPETVMEECRNEAEERFQREKPSMPLAALAVAAVWLLLAGGLAWLVYIHWPEIEAVFMSQYSPCVS